jgi:hypothetical protein
VGNVVGNCTLLALANAREWKFVSVERLFEIGAVKLTLKNLSDDKYVSDPIHDPIDAFKDGLD